MKDFFAWLFSQNNSTLQIGLFDVWHFLYLFIILGGSVLLAVLFHTKPEKTREKLLRIMALITIGIYVADFFIMPLSDSYNGISVDKLPFHVCTLMSVMVPFVQFNKKLKPLLPTIVTMSVASSMMWMCYPGSALGGQPPFSYVIFQTFMFHGFLFCWGFLNLALGKVTLKFKNIWKELCCTLIILVWAWFGNTVYAGHNWFFIKESIFPFLPDKVMPPVVVFCVFGTCFLVYVFYYAIKAILSHSKERTKSYFKLALAKNK